MSYNYFRKNRRRALHAASVELRDLEWHWLPGFPGANGPILGLSRATGLVDYPRTLSRFRELEPTTRYDGSGLTGAGKDELIGSGISLYITGAFNNLPSVMLYKSGHISPIGNSGQVKGLVTGVREMSILYKSKGKDDSKQPQSDGPAIEDDQLLSVLDTLIVFFAVSSVMYGIYYGLLRSAWRNNSSSFGNSRSVFPFASQSVGDASGGYVLTLEALGGHNSTVDLESCYHRAMRARHIRATGSLQFLSSNEITLDHIIGQGSFGRVWCGKYKTANVAVKEFVLAQAAVVGGSVDRIRIIEEIVGKSADRSITRCHHTAV